MQMGNPKGLRKKDKARPEAPPAGQANAHEHFDNFKWLLLLRW